jgi:WAP-type (Whey Acidic protein) with four-disulfide core
MRRRILLIAFILAATAILSIGLGALNVASAATALPSVHPCNSDADCPGGLVCCSTGFCSTRKACRL